jgi:hypothetical protein
MGYKIDDPMFLRESSRPGSRTQIFKRFWLAEARKGIAHDGLDHAKSSQGDFPIGCHPIPQVFAKFRMEHRGTLRFG